MNSTTLLFIAIFGIAIFVLLAAAFGSPYVRATHLFTPAETNFYKQLARAVQGEYLVFGKVRVADLVNVKGAGSRKSHMQALGRIAQKHVDFCLCHPHDLSIVCVLELNDKSHNRADRIKRDDFLAKVFKKVKLPIVWVPASKHYNPQELRRKIQDAIYQTQLEPSK